MPCLTGGLTDHPGLGDRGGPVTRPGPCCRALPLEWAIWAEPGTAGMRGLRAGAKMCSISTPLLEPD